MRTKQQEMAAQIVSARTKLIRIRKDLTTYSAHPETIAKVQAKVQAAVVALYDAAESLGAYDYDPIDERSKNRSAR